MQPGNPIQGEIIRRQETTPIYSVQQSNIPVYQNHHQSTNVVYPQTSSVSNYSNLPSYYTTTHSVPQQSYVQQQPVYVQQPVQYQVTQE